MSSSTSNSDPSDTAREAMGVPRRSPLRGLLAERTAVALVVAIVVTVAIGQWRPIEHADTLLPTQYWAIKMEWKACADVVLAGDSRINAGLAPTEMAGSLPDRRILNFGFYAVAFTPQYLEAIEDVLDPDSGEPIIVLGISPHSLSPRGARNNQFITEKKSPQNRSALTKWVLGRFPIFYRR